MPPDGIANTNQPAFSDSTTGNFTGPEGAIATPGYDQEFQKAIEAAADGREVETIKLFKPENSSLGFSVIGLKRENQGEIGIFVQDLQPGGIAARWVKSFNYLAVVLLSPHKSIKGGYFMCTYFSGIR